MTIKRVIQLLVMFALLYISVFYYAARINSSTISVAVPPLCRRACGWNGCPTVDCDCLGKELIFRDSAKNDGEDLSMCLGIPKYK